MTEFTITQKDNKPLFLANTDVFPAPQVGGFMLYMQNTSAETMIMIEKITASAGENGGVLRWFKDVQVSEFADAELVAPIGLNGGGKAETICYKWDGMNNGIAGISGGVLLKPAVLEGYTPVDISLSLGLFDNIALHFTPTVGDTLFECGVLFSQETIDE